ncbi:serine protease inhibitor 42Dd-like [Thrips palmi]|uniref:Serine protease inhibitor 42Dd-like n=1 Tax=Thrips palmi TaxID=161013 RepID=A0A6P8ZVG9_THRPL|nr:serine protease inhibitor 42Dd-like [Thrips palmi]
MKLELLLAVVFLSGWSLCIPQRRVSHYGHQALLRQAPKGELPVDKFNFIDIELLQLTAESEAGNVVLSPASVKTTLSMLWEGAEGRTAQEIGSALRLHGRSRDKQEQQLHQYQQNLTVPAAQGEQPSSTLNVASQVFYNNHVTINPAYSDALANYGARTQAVNMSDPALAAATINKWVSTATHGHLPSLVEPDSLSDNPVMMLANAVFFQGTWQVAFDPLLTQESCFYASASEPCHKVQMMETMGSFRSKLIHELEATLLEMPYNDGRFSMLILLPERRDGMQELMRNIVFANLLHVLNSDLEDSEYVVSIPKFSIEYSTDLVPVLNKLRVVDVFSPAANLSRMLKQDATTRVEPAVSNVFHKSKIVVNEEGAIASGATGALVVPLMGGPQPKFRADHPFLFFIRDVKTGGFLFAGRVSRPEAADVAQPEMPAVLLSEMKESATAGPSSATSKRSNAAAAQQNVKDDINFPTNGSRD